MTKTGKIHIHFNGHIREFVDIIETDAVHHTDPQAKKAFAWAQKYYPIEKGYSHTWVKG